MLAGARIDNMSALYRHRYKAPRSHAASGREDSLYVFFMPARPIANRSFTPGLPRIKPGGADRIKEGNSMSILDGVSLGLAPGLFIYLRVALLRAGRR
jgi:hypothetical protein